MSKKVEEGEKEKKHEFWETQPVLKADEAQQLKKHAPKEFTPGALESKKVDEISKEPYPIASILEWYTPDLNNGKDLEEIYQLLYNNYVEDDDAQFRFNYSKSFLKWAMMPPGYIQDWHIAVRKKDESKELMAFISGIPSNIRMGDTTKQICEINFLCVSKRLRDKRLAPILIKEVTRRVNLKDIWQAVYTAGKELPTPVSTPRYYHRNLNPEKLLSINFSYMPASFEKMKNPMDSWKRSLAVTGPRLTGMRRMKEADLPAVTELLKKQLESTQLAPSFDQAEMKHWLLPKDDGIVYAFVREKEDVITDFVSFYQLCSTILNNEKYKNEPLKAAYAYYYSANTADVAKLFNEALYLAKENNFDVFNALNIMQNEKFINELTFGKGDGQLRYYLFNWKMIPCTPDKIGLMMM